MLCCCVVFWGAVWCVVCGVCTFKTSPCVLAPRAHMFHHVAGIHGDVLDVHTGTCWTDTRGRERSSLASCFSSAKRTNF